MKAKVTKRLVDSVTTEKSDLWVADTELQGFSLRVRQSGSKYYVLRYRFQGERRKMVIGRHGSPWTPDSARREALRLLGLVVSGIDPFDQEKRAKQGLTVEELCLTYLEEAEAGRILTKRGHPKKASTLAADRGAVHAHIIPLLGKRKIGSVVRPDIVSFRNDVTAGKSKSDRRTSLRGRSMVRGGPASAARTLATLSAIYSYAIAQELVGANPVFGVEKQTSKRRTVTLSPDDYCSLHKALNVVEAASYARRANYGTRVGIAAIRVLFLTGCRRNEIMSLLKTEVDAEAGCFRFSDTKTQAQSRPIGATAMEFVQAQEWEENSPYVFPAARGNGHLIGIQRTWVEVRKIAGLDNVPLHTARHGFASVAWELGYSELTIGGLLGHSSGSVTARYIHLVDPALVSAANEVSAVIAARMDGEKEETDNVFSLRGSH